MIKVLRIASISIVVLAATLWSSPAGAQQCTGISQPFGHLLDTWITGLDDNRRVTAIASAPRGGLRHPGLRLITVSRYFDVVDHAIALGADDGPQ